MKLVIRRNHTEGIRFDNLRDGALTRAAREQLPELMIIGEYDGFCKDSKGNNYSFDNSASGYNRKTFQDLKNNYIKDISITLERNNIF